MKTMRKHKDELIKWSHTLSCGIQLIDDQHKGLVNLVNDMFNNITGDHKQEHAYFNKVIQEAVKYVKVHFATEEKIMIATKFGGYPEHKKAHDHFVLTVVDKIKEYQSGNKMTLKSFTKFLREWILSHVAVMDKQYFDYFRKIASRKADGKLSINSDDVAIFS
jgi:hemerythrin